MHVVRQNVVGNWWSFVKGKPLLKGWGVEWACLGAEGRPEGRVCWYLCCIGENFKVSFVVSASFFHVETYAERMDRAKSAQSLLPSKRTNKTCRLICAVEERALPPEERALPKRNRRCLLSPTEGKKEAELHAEHGLEQLAHPTITLARKIAALKQSTKTKYSRTSQVAQHN
eukprot:scaffold9302_cov109-Cylindrotheca_fusiformis.AAC.1